MNHNRPPFPTTKMHDHDHDHMSNWTQKVSLNTQKKTQKKTTVNTNRNSLEDDGGESVRTTDETIETTEDLLQYTQEEEDMDTTAQDDMGLDLAEDYILE